MGILRKAPRDWQPRVCLWQGPPQPGPWDLGGVSSFPSWQVTMCLLNTRGACRLWVPAEGLRGGRSPPSRRGRLDPENNSRQCGRRCLPAGENYVIALRDT